MKWKDITLFKFQQIEQINGRADLSDIDKSLWSVCFAYDKTETELDEMGWDKVSKMMAGLKEVFEKPFQHKAKKRIGKYIVNYDPSSLTFGQFIELSFFLKDHIKNAHYALASITRPFYWKYETEKHRERADYFLNQPVETCMGSLIQFVENFKKFNAEYSGLFGADTEIHGEQIKTDKFINRYGWIYSATLVAEYERISMDDTFSLPVRQALNALAYLKAKAKYDYEQSKRA